MKYLIAIHRPNDFAHEDMLGPEVREAIDRVNDEMVAAGVRLFVGGLYSPSSATSIRLQSNGDVTVSEGPYLEASDYVDGLWVLECETKADAIEWGRKAALACRGSVEVRPFAGATMKE
jgi:hypothetical protein